MFIQAKVSTTKSYLNFYSSRILLPPEIILTEAIAGVFTEAVIPRPALWVHANSMSTAGLLSTLCIA